MTTEFERYIDGYRIVNLPITVMLDMFRASDDLYLCLTLDRELFSKLTGASDYWFVYSSSVMDGVINGLPGVKLAACYSEMHWFVATGVGTLYSVFNDFEELYAMYFGDVPGGCYGMPERDFRIKLLEKIVELNPGYVIPEIRTKRVVNGG